MELLQILSLAIALFMFWLFAVAGFHKLNPVNELYYKTLLEDFGLLKADLANLFIKLTGVVEVIIAFAIVYPETRVLAALFAASLLAFYMLHMIYQLYQGKSDLDCGCSGPAGQLKISGQLVVRNLLLISLTFFCLTPVARATNDILLLGTLFAVTGIFISLSTEQLLSNAQKLKTLRN